MSKSKLELAERVARTVRAQNLFQPGDTIIVAISGGADSTAMLDLISGLPGFSLKLVAAHLNHCLRGSASDEDEESCRQLALRYDIPFESRRIAVREYASQNRLNLEDAGRRLRTSFFTELRDKWQASAVALAHHADDQVETVLMNLLRGTGSDGLSGMPYRNSRGFIRPMLDIYRREIDAYLAERGLNWREDASNLDTAFLRNSIRHELLPLLEQYNPAIRERLTTTSRLIADENKLLEQLAEQSTARVCSSVGGALRCDIRQFSEEPAPLRRRVFRIILERLTGTLDNFSSRHLAALDQLLYSSRPNATLNLPQGVIASKEYDTLLLQRSANVAPITMDELILEGQGEYPLPNGSTLIISIESTPPQISKIPPDINCFDLSKAPFPWRIRTFRNGDRIIPFGMNGSKKIKDLFIDHKIPLRQRRTIPILFSGHMLLWVCGLQRSDYARVGCETSMTAVARLFQP